MSSAQPELAGWLDLLTHGLDHLPAKRDHLRRLGDIFAHLRDPVQATAGAGGKCLDDNPLARQVIRERLAHRMAAREGAHSAGFSLIFKCCAMPMAVLDL